MKKAIGFLKICIMIMGVLFLAAIAWVLDKLGIDNSDFMKN